MENPAPQNNAAGKDLDQLRFELERDKTCKELALRERELGQKKSEVSKPLLVALIAGTLALFSNALVTYLNNAANEKLTKEKVEADVRLAKDKFESDARLAKDKFQSDLILEVTKTGNQESAHNNLRFLLEAGFVSDPNNQISAALNKKSLAPLTLPSINKPVITTSSMMEFVLKAEYMGNPAAGAKIVCGGQTYVADSDGQIFCTLPAGTQSVYVSAIGPDNSRFSDRISIKQQTIPLTKSRPTHSSGPGF